MISVSIFILRNVIRRVRAGYKIPYNGQRHTSPSITKELEELQSYLRDHSIQSYHEACEGEEFAKPVRDLFSEGVKYASSASAFKNFRPVVSKATHKGTQGLAGTHETEVTDADDEGAEDSDLLLDSVEMDDLLADEEEFDADADLGDIVSCMRDVVNALIESD